MNCIEIVIKYLEDNGFDGLHRDAECGCEISDLVPCGNDFASCKPGYKLVPPDSSYEFDFYICDSKDDSPWDQ